MTAKRRTSSSSERAKSIGFGPAKRRTSSSSERAKSIDFGLSSKALRILVIHGPNLNLLGQRETGIYGKQTINDINKSLEKEAEGLKASIKIFQSNHEGKMVDLIGKANKNFAGILINPAAYTHTSVAVRDALLACALPAVEVHLSNIYKREEFRQHSMTAPACIGQVAGFGMQSYLLGLQALVYSIREIKKA